MTENSVVLPWRDAVKRLAQRIEDDYRLRVRPYARGIGVWGSSTIIGVEVPLGGRIGPMWGHHTRYAKKTGPLGLFGRRIIIKDLDAVEAELRQALDEWLAEQEGRQR